MKPISRIKSNVIVGGFHSIQQILSLAIKLPIIVAIAY